MSQSDYLKRKKLATELKNDHATNHPSVLNSKQYLNYLSYSLGNNIENTKITYNKIVPSTKHNIFNIEQTTTNCPDFECTDSSKRPNRVDHTGRLFDEKPFTWDDKHNSTFDNRSCCDKVITYITYSIDGIEYNNLTDLEVRQLRSNLQEHYANQLGISKNSIIINFETGSLKINIGFLRNESIDNDTLFLTKLNDYYNGNSGNDLLVKCKSVLGNDTLTIDANKTDMYMTNNNKSVVIHTLSNYVFDNTNLRTAVNAWISIPATATSTYGHISKWDTRNITDMSNLFKDKADFNDDISTWNTDKVTTIAGMFDGCTNFNQKLASKVVRDSIATSYTSWNLSKNTSLQNTFNGATNFNQPIDGWNVSLVDTMAFAFNNAVAFEQNILVWNITDENVDFDSMFFGATKMISTYNVNNTPSFSDFNK